MEKTIYTTEYAALLQLLKTTREQKGYTQIDLAKKLGQSQSFVSKIECGDRRIDIVQLRTICTVLGISLVEFVQQWERQVAQAT